MRATTHKIRPPEHKTIEQATELLLHGIGEDREREGLLDTPARVARAWAEMTAGYHTDVAAILSRDFDGGGYDQMIALPDVPFYSTCEHHLLPFHGTATIGYIPGKKVVGLSKLARLVEAFARRLQIQERMTQQIAEALHEHLKPKGVGVVVRATHLCMQARGARSNAGPMTTSSLAGLMKTDDKARNEFLRLAGV